MTEQEKVAAISKIMPSLGLASLMELHMTVMNQMGLKRTGQGLTDRFAEAVGFNLPNRTGMSRFRVNDRVWFNARGRRHEGFVTRVNRKTFGVMVEGRNWRVSPGYLNAMVTP